MSLDDSLSASFLGAFIRNIFSVELPLLLVSCQSVFLHGLGAILNTDCGCCSVIAFHF